MPAVLRHTNPVLAHCRQFTNRSCSRVCRYVTTEPNRIREVIDDWRALRSPILVRDDPSYLRHRGAPLVAVQGIGLNDEPDLDGTLRPNPDSALDAPRLPPQRTLP